MTGALHGRLVLSCLAGLALSSAPARAVIFWDESHQGDLSGNRFAPSAFTMVPGANQLIGVMTGDSGQGPDRDYFSVTIPSGYALSRLELDFYVSMDFTAFIAIQPGPIFPNDPDTVNPEDLLGWMHFGPNEVNADLLPMMGAPGQGQGFTPPLPAGTYTFWAQQTGDYTDYGLDFVVEVPSPATLPLAIGPLLMRRRRR